MKMNKLMYDMLHTQALAERQKAFLTLELMSNHPAGIGDHGLHETTYRWWCEPNDAAQAVRAGHAPFPALGAGYD